MGIPETIEGPILLDQPSKRPQGAMEKRRKKTKKEVAELKIFPEDGERGNIVDNVDVAKLTEQLRHMVDPTSEQLREVSMDEEDDEKPWDDRAFFDATIMSRDVLSHERQRELMDKMYEELERWRAAVLHDPAGRAVAITRLVPPEKQMKRMPSKELLEFIPLRPFPYNEMTACIEEMERAKGERAEAPPLVPAMGRASPNGRKKDEKNDDAAIARAARDAWHSLRTDLCLTNAKLCVKTTKRFRSKGIGERDLNQIALLGILEGIDRFDVKQNARVTTYVTWWILQALRLAMKKESKAIRIPAHMYDAFAKAQTFVSKYFSEHDDQPPIEQVAAHIKLSVEETEKLLRMGKPLYELDKPMGINQRGAAQANIVQDLAVPDFHVDLIRQDRGEFIVMMQRCLMPIEQEILDRKFGLKTGQEQTLREIGQAIGVTHERIRQRLNQIRNKLRKRFGGHPALEDLCSDD